MSERGSERRYSLPYEKIMGSREQAADQIRQWREQGFRIVVTDAVLDIPTFKHAEYFMASANLGDKLVVRMPTDQYIATYKDHRGPIVGYNQRAMHAAHYPYVDLIVPNNSHELEWVEMFRPDIVVKSVTTGVGAIKSADGLLPELDKVGGHIVYLDENANVIDREEFERLAHEYDATKYDTSHVSGTVIKAEIRRRAIEDYLQNQSTITDSPTVQN